jgi:CRISPR-associated protein Cas5d
MTPYPVQMEVEGPLAVFARPDTGGTPTSYPVPTWLAAKGMFESIAFFADGAAWICPTRGEASCAKQGPRSAGDLACPSRPNGAGEVGLFITKIFI